MTAKQSTVSEISLDEGIKRRIGHQEEGTRSDADMTTTMIQSHGADHLKETTREDVMIALREIVHQQLELEKEICLLRKLQDFNGRTTDALNSAQSTEIDATIETVLGEMCELTTAERGYVFLYDDEGLMSNTHEFYVDELDPVKTQMQNIAQKELQPWLYERFTECDRDECITLDVVDMPEEASAEQQQFQAQGITSLVSYPMKISNTLVGFVGVASKQDEKAWEKGVTDMVKGVGKNLISVLERQHEAEELRKEIRERQRIVLEKEEALRDREAAVKENERLNLLKDIMLQISEAPNTSVSMEEMIANIQTVLREIWEEKVNNFYVALYDEKTGTYSFPFYTDDNDKIKEDFEAVDLSGSLTDFVRCSRKPILVDAAMNDKLIEDGKIEGVVGTNATEWLGAPLRTDNGVFGVVAVQTYDKAQYTEDDLKLLHVAGLNIAQAIEKKKKKAELETRIITDDLMNIYNRGHILKRLEEEFERTARYNRDMSIIMLDIDHFKSMNDSHGHQIGDQVLKGLGALLKATVRNSDMVGRYGGDEIVIVLPEIPDEEAAICAEKIKTALADVRKFVSTMQDPTSIQLQEERGKLEDFAELLAMYKIDLTLSQGVASMSGIANKTAHELIRVADEALYEAKDAGRNGVKIVRTAGEESREDDSAQNEPKVSQTEPNRTILNLRGHRRSVPRTRLDKGGLEKRPMNKG